MKLVVGYNYPGPSNKFGNWLGPFDRQDNWPKDYTTRWKDLEFKKQMAANLKILQDNGVEVVRWFLLGNGFNYGMPAKVEYLDNIPGAPVMLPRFVFDPPDRLDPLFLDHFQQLLDMHSAINRQLIPSLVSFEFFNPYIAFPPGYAGGRGDVAVNAEKRNKFLSTVLGEFLRVSASYKKGIRAWEVINEPAWDVRSISPPITGSYTPTYPVVTLDAMRTFIYLAHHLILNAGFESTVGHRFLSDLSIMPTGSLPQFHYYSTYFVNPSLADPETLPPSSVAKASIIGEFAGLVGKGKELNENPKKGSYGEPWETATSRFP